jgi:hypothetical protein
MLKVSAKSIKPVAVPQRKKVIRSFDLLSSKKQTILLVQFTGGTHCNSTVHFNYTSNTTYYYEKNENNDYSKYIFYIITVKLHFSYYFSRASH